MEEKQKCRHLKRIKTEDMMVCSACGMVLEYVGLVEGDPIAFKGSGSQRVVVPPKSKVLSALADNLKHKLGLSDAVMNQAIQVLERALNEGMVNQGKSGRLALGSVVFLLCRRIHDNNPEALPISLEDLASFLDCRPSDFIRYLSTMSHLMSSEGNAVVTGKGPEIFIERYLVNVICKEEGLHDLPVKKIEHLSRQLCNYCHRNSLVEGRKPQCISLACLLVSLECLLAGQLGTKSEWKQTIEKICKYAEQSPRTISDRINEIKTCLLNDASKMTEVEFTKNLKKEQVSIYAEMILQYSLASEVEASSRPAPPSSKASQIQREKRQKQLDLAKSRLKDPSIVTDDIEVLIMERLLLHAVPEDRLVNVVSMNELLSLEWELCPHSLSSSYLDDETGFD